MTDTNIDEMVGIINWGLGLLKNFVKEKVYAI